METKVKSALYLARRSLDRLETLRRIVGDEVDKKYAGKIIEDMKSLVNELTNLLKEYFD